MQLPNLCRINLNNFPIHINLNHSPQLLKSRWYNNSLSIDSVHNFQSPILLPQLANICHKLKHYTLNIQPIPS